MPNYRPSVELDVIDRAILNLLQKNGRLSNVELADQIGLSPSPCLRRVKHLEASGIIGRYVAILDSASVGLHVTVFTRVALANQEQSNLVQFEAAVAEWPEVMECYLMSGESDYQLRVLVHDLGDYETFLRERLTKVPGIAKIQSSFAFRPVVSRTSLPLTPN